MNPNDGVRHAPAMEKIAFLLLSVLFVFLPFYEGGMTAFSIFIQHALLLLAGGVLLLSFRSRPDIPIEIRWIEIILFVLFFWILLSLMYAAYPYAALLEVLRYFFLGILFVLLKYLLGGDPGRRKILGAVICLSCCLSSGFALYQYFFCGVPRPSAWFLNTNNLACILNIGFFLLLFSDLPGFLKRRPVWFVLAALMGSGLYFARSRSGLIAFFIVLLVALLRKRKILMLIPMVGVLLLFLVPNPLKTYLQELPARDIYAFQRVDIWKMDLNMIADYPLLGVAAGHFDLYSPRYNFPVERGDARYGKIPLSAHNIFLHYAAELGIPMGLIVFAASIMLWILFFSSRETGTGYFAAMCAVLVQDLFYENLFNNAVAAAFLFCLVSAGLDERRLVFRSLVDKCICFASRSGTGRRLIGKGFAVCFGVTFLFLLVMTVIVPFAADIRYNRAVSRHGEKDFLGTFRAIQAAERLLPMHAGYHRFLGGLYSSYFFSRKEPQAFFYASRKFDQSLSLNPLDPECWMERAALYGELFTGGLPTRECFDRAESSYRSAARVSPYNPFIYQNLAALYLSAGERRKGEASLLKAVALEPNFIAARCMLFKLYLEEGREGEASEEAEILQALVARYAGQTHPPGSYLEALFQIPEDCLSTQISLH